MLLHQSAEVAYIIAGVGKEELWLYCHKRELQGTLVSYSMLDMKLVCACVRACAPPDTLFQDLVPQKARKRSSVMSARKPILATFCFTEQVVLVDAIPKSETVYGDAYTKPFQNLQQRLCRFAERVSFNTTIRLRIQRRQLPNLAGQCSSYHHVVVSQCLLSVLIVLAHWDLLQ